MDPITLILTALAAGASTGGQAIVSEAIKDSYSGLKTLIQRKFAGKPVAEMALTQHETDPQVWQAPLKQALQQEHLDQDATILKAAKALLDRLQAQSGGRHSTQSIVGNYNAQAQGSGSASVNVTQPRE